MGAIRLFLALGVVFAHTRHNVHLHTGLIADKGWWLNIIGDRAVIFFYIVSGFLISYALHEKYQPTTAGTLAFFRSRFLRIFPLWWVVLIACLLIDRPSWPLGHSLTVLQPAALFGTDWLIAFWTYPTRYWGGLPNGASIGWTLGAELTFYVLAPWVLRSGRMALALMLTSVMVRLVVAFLFLSQDPDGLYVTWGYFFFPAVLMFFLLGHYANILARTFPLGTPISIAALAFAAFFSWLDPFFIGSVWSYLSCICFAAALPGLFAVTKDGRIFNFLGDLTYPLYLTHTVTVATLFWPIRFARPIGELLLAVAAYFGSPVIGGAFLMTVVCCITLAVAVVTHFAIEKPARRLAAMLFFRRMPDRIPTPA